MSVHVLCRYIPAEDLWQWKADLPWNSLHDGGMARWEEREWMHMENILKKLEQRNPLMGKATIYPRYYRPSERRGTPE